MPATYLIGDVSEQIAKLEPGSVDLVMTSPPFLALRSYLPADHPNKHREIGSEPDPAAFIDVLCSVVDELSTVLAPHGSIVFELGDTYAGSGGAGGDYNAGGWRESQNFWSGSAQKRGVWPRPKSLSLIPELFRVTLAYGVNPLNGRVWWEGDDRWLVRNVVRWVKPNPPVGALGDKFRPATSEMAVFTRNPKRYFDLDAVRTEPTVPPHTMPPRGVGHEQARKAVGLSSGSRSDNGGNPGGAPPLDWWKLSPSGYPGSHYATYPAELCVIPIKSMCPEWVCKECGTPAPTSCGHESWRPGMVLDPFAGTGVTLAVATGHGRNAIGIDIDERNAELALERVGPLMLEVVR